MTVITLDADLEPLIANYLQRREEEIIALQQALAAQDFPPIQSVGHNLKGSGAAYGLDEISAIGSELELAAKAADSTAVLELIQRLQNYLKNLEVQFD